MEKALKTDLYVWQGGNFSTGRAGSGGGKRGTKYAAGRNIKKFPKKRRLYKKIFAGLWLYFTAVGVIVTCWLIGSILFGSHKKVQKAADVGVKSLQMPESEETSGGQAISEELRQMCQNLYLKNEELLILVNKEQELSEQYRPVLRQICNGRLQAADVLYEDLCAMLQAAGKEGYEYWIASAYRSREYQQRLVDEDVEKYKGKGYSYEEAMQKTLEYTMPAGFSEHETGLALDILCSTNTMMDDSQAGEPGNKWLQEHLSLIHI